MKPRPYQEDVPAKIFEWFARHPYQEGLVENPIVQACVGAGKSFLIAYTSYQAMTTWPSTRIIVIVHQKELLQQNLDKLRRVWPDAPVGIWSASMGMRQVGDITYATIGSIYKYAHMLGKVSLIYADECHLINPKEEGMWRAFIADVRKYCNPKVRVIGWTGTAYRGNGVWLTAGDTPIFTGTAAVITMKQLLDLGFLAPLIPAKVETILDIKVAESNGDYSVSELAKVADVPEKVTRACDSIVHVGRTNDRKKWLVFATNVEHGKHITEGLKARGVRAEMIWGDMSTFERNRLIGEEGAYRTGEVECLVNVGVLTTGFDVPEIDFIALLRKTKSPVLYVQICGRGMRVIGADIHTSMAAGKYDCLFADYTGTVEELGPVDAVTGRMPRKAGKKGAPFRICPSCSARCKIQDLKCPDCGHEFPEIEKIKHDVEPSGAAMLSSQLKDELEGHIKVREISHVTYVPYTKEGKNPCLMVNYFRNITKVATEFLHIESRGRPQHEAEYWWTQRTGMREMPATVAQALSEIRRLKTARRLREPHKIRIDTSSQHPKIMEVFYADSAQAAPGSLAAAATALAATGADASGVGIQPGLFEGQQGGDRQGDQSAAGDPSVVPVVRSLSKWVVPTGQPSKAAT